MSNCIAVHLGLEVEGAPLQQLLVRVGRLQDLRAPAGVEVVMRLEGDHHQERTHHATSPIYLSIHPPTFVPSIRRAHTYREQGPLGAVVTKEAGRHAGHEPLPPFPPRFHPQLLLRLHWMYTECPQVNQSVCRATTLPTNRHPLRYQDPFTDLHEMLDVPCQLGQVRRAQCAQVLIWGV